MILLIEQYLCWNPVNMSRQRSFLEPFKFRHHHSLHYLPNTACYSNWRYEASSKGVFPSFKRAARWLIFQCSGTVPETHVLLKYLNNTVQAPTPMWENADDEVPLLIGADERLHIAWAAFNSGIITFSLMVFLPAGWPSLSTWLTWLNSSITAAVWQWIFGRAHWTDERWWFAMRSSRADRLEHAVKEAVPMAQWCEMWNRGCSVCTGTGLSTTGKLKNGGLYVLQRKTAEGFGKDSPYDQTILAIVC